MVAKAKFLREFVACGNVGRSAKAAKVGRAAVYHWLEVDERFKELYAQAYEDALDALEEEAAVCYTARQSRLTSRLLSGPVLGLSSTRTRSPS